MEHPTICLWCGRLPREHGPGEGIRCRLAWEGELRLIRGVGLDIAPGRLGRLRCHTLPYVLPLRSVSPVAYSIEALEAKGPL